MTTNVYLADWQIRGEAKRVSEKWISKCATKALINERWRLNKKIDMGAPKPACLNPVYWKKLIEVRGTEAAQLKSQKMRDIAKGKGSSAAQMKAIEREVVSRLVSHSHFVAFNFYCCCSCQSSGVFNTLFLVTSRWTSMGTNSCSRGQLCQPPLHKDCCIAIFICD